MKLLKKTILFVFCYGLFFANAQEIPPIETFMPEVYGAEDQNWSISQGQDEVMYFANNKGLLVYNGAKWQLYDSPNSSIVRSVKVIGEKIFIGNYMDFGYWVKDDFGILQYTSIVQNKNINLLEDEEFWNILEFDQWILFQSLDRIYIYNTQNEGIQLIESETTITKIFKVGDSIYFQKINQGIYKFENGQEILVTDNQLLINKIVINVFQDGDGVLLQTKEDGFYIFEKGVIKTWDTQLNKKLSNYSIYNTIKLRNGDYILGTVSNGIIYVNKEKEITYEINQSSGLGNNTILSLFEDMRGNVWLGLDHGINNINFKAPFRVYKDNLGIIGTVYTTLIENDIFYLGTNQGLFYKDHTKNETFKFVKGTEGQVWHLSSIQNQIFCGHDKGTFIIENQRAKKISDIDGTWIVKEVENSPNLLIQGNYNGLYILEKRSNNWYLRNKIKGFDISSRYIEFLSQNELLVSHEYKGVYRIEVDKQYRNIVSLDKTKIEKNVKSSLISYNGQVYYGAKDGVFGYNKLQKEFVRDSILSQLYSFQDYSSGKLVHSNDKLFAFSNKGITYVERGKLSANYQLSFLPLPNSVRETKDGYENISYIGKNQYLIGTSRGYIISELTNNLDPINYTVKLNQVTSHRLNGKSRFLNLLESSELDNDENYLQFSFSVTDYNKYLPSFYQYRLNGFNDSWTDWSVKSNAVFENLPYGEYTFEVRAKVGSTIAKNTSQYQFTILKPWYISSTAVILYIVLSFIVVIIVHLIYRTYYRNQRKKLLKQKERELEIKQLENEQQLMYFKNLDLQKDIEAKNRELGMSAMNLVKRNELLSTIKKELSAAVEVEDLSKVVKLINKNLEGTSDWEVFEEAFNNTDKDFIKKLKTQHVNLTSNDIRLCTYLRLNLSSKEIAPLLNISIRSVEVKRYRLRKKMNLPHEASLSSYILQL